LVYKKSNCAKEHRSNTCLNILFYPQIGSKSNVILGLSFVFAQALEFYTQILLHGKFDCIMYNFIVGQTGKLHPALFSFVS
jgi:hypothetical protein